MVRDGDVLVVGAGIVGLAAAAALARSGRSVNIVEREDGIARGTTSRSSQVIHAGIYYPPGTLKARFCVAGARAVYERCARFSIPHRRVGKLIVATDESQIDVIERLERNGRESGVDGLDLIDGPAVRRLEPEVRAILALRSPVSGIVDAHALALSFLTEAEAHGASLLRRTEVLALERRARDWRVDVRRADGGRESVHCAAVVNAAGLAGDRIAELGGLDVDGLGYRLKLCKGDYFMLDQGSLGISRLIYPVPGRAGLGIHATLDLEGRVRFGPDSEYVSTASTVVDPAKAQLFASSVARYLPAISQLRLVPDYAGIRPKLAGEGEPFRDFVVAEESASGCPGMVSCIGIESPGLTAAPAIGERVAQLLSSL